VPAVVVASAVVASADRRPADQHSPEHRLPENNLKEFAMSIDRGTRDAISDESVDGFTPPGMPKERSRWRRMPSAGLVLGCLILAAGGFVGGVLEAKHTGTTSATTGGATAAAGARTGAGFVGGGGASQGATATIGTVKLVDGSTIYVTTTNGSVVKVTTSGTTKLSVSATGKATDLKAGAAITVTGTTDASGTINATAVTQSGNAPTGSPAAAGQGSAGAGSAPTPSTAPTG
jgi:hypothetical protein